MSTAVESHHVDPATPIHERSVTAGVRWSLIAMAGRQFGRMAFALLLARMLGPENYGIIGQATVYIAFTALLLDQGFGAALIQRKRLEEHEVGSVVWLNIVSGIALALITIAVAPLVAAFFRSPELTAVLRILALGVLLKGAAVVPTALLTRRLEFRSLAIVEITAVVVSGAAGVFVALAGGEYWALVVQVLVLDVAYTIGVVSCTGIPELRASMSALRSMWRFSSRVMASQILNYGSRNLDNVLIGRVLGATPLAYYSIAYRVLLLPLQMLSQVVSRVAYPVFSRLQDERDRMGRYFLHASRTIALVAFPAMTLVIVSAPDLVPLVLGRAWEPAVLPMQILAVTAMRQAVLSVVGDVFMACGHAEWRLRFSIVSTALLVASFLIGLQWGIVGVAVAYGVADAVLHPVVVGFAGRLTNLKMRDYLASLLPGTAGALAFAVAWVAGRMAWGTVSPFGLGSFSQVVSCTILAAGVYVLILIYGWPTEARNLRALLVGGRARPRTPGRGSPADALAPEDP